MSSDAVLKEAQDKMDRTLRVLDDQFAGVRTGKASPALVENIQVPYYGAPTRLRDLANISTPEPRLVVISPYDPTVLGEIERSILGANIGVTPIGDGRVVRVPVPELSEDRRKEMSKVAHRMAEEARVAVRNVRREANEAAKALEKSGAMSEDELSQLLARIQKATDAAIGRIDAASKSKDSELMAV